MDNFDLRKFLAEGKLYEEATSTEEAMDKPSSTKMKMSELKAKIRTEILAELTLNEDDDVDFGTGGEETEGKDGENVDPVAEATKDGDGEVPPKDANTDVDIVDKEKVKVDVKEKPAMSGVDNEFLDQLEDLQDEAGELGDDKLERQINNTITYFTRQHIAKDTNESLELEEDLEQSDVESAITGQKLDLNKLKVATEKAMKGDSTDLAMLMAGIFEADELEEADDMALVADLEAELKEEYSEFQRVNKGKKNTVARNKGEEEVYGAGVKKGEEIEKKKLKELLKTPNMKNLTPAEIAVVDDLTESINEGSIDLSKVKNYAKKGLMTLGVIATLLGGANLTLQQKQDVVDTVKTEIPSQNQQDLKYMSDAYTAHSLYLTNKADIEKLAQTNSDVDLLIKDSNFQNFDKLDRVQDKITLGRSNQDAIKVIKAEYNLQEKLNESLTFPLWNKIK